EEGRERLDPAGRLVEDALAGAAPLRDEHEQGGAVGGEPAEGGQAAVRPLQHRSRGGGPLIVPQLLIFGFLAARRAPGTCRGGRRRAARCGRAEGEGGQ